MKKLLFRFVLPLLLFSASLVDWSLISLVDLIAFLVILFNVIRLDFRSHRIFQFLWGISIFSLLVAFIQAIIIIIWAIKSGNWSLVDSSWVKLVGFMGFQSWRSPTVIFFFVLQLLVGLVCLAVLFRHKLGLVPRPVSCWGRFSSILVQLGSYVKVFSCFSFPAIQLAVGICHPSWVSLPFFICSCVGLVDWSFTSNFSGLFRWWRPLQLYAGFNILLLYMYQLPMGLPALINQIAKFIGLYKISAESGWLELCSCLSLIGFYTFLSFIKTDLEEMELMMSGVENDLSEQLLPARHSFFIRQSRSGERHTNVLIKGAVFRIFTINFFTYGFPLSLFALCFWSFYFASICAFGLLVYVGYVVYAFPSLFRLHRLNGLLLVFILLWAVSTYIFNVAFTFVNWNLKKDMEVWELIGLWRYSNPGYFLLAQFGLGVLIAVGNLVNNSVFTHTFSENDQIQDGEGAIEVSEETKVLTVATIAWGLRKCSRAIVLLLIFLIAMKPGFVHAVYMIFFLLYVLEHSISKNLRQALILLCEIHFALSYIIQINMISENLERKGSLAVEILTQLGLLDLDSSWDFLEMALLACFCAVQNHGFQLLFSFSAVVQHTPCHPVGFSVLKAGLNKSVLLSVYSSSPSGSDSNGASQERRIAAYLSSVGQKFLALYRSWGAYVAYLTILVAVYLVRPNYISFGYVFLLLFWIIGRQLVGRTRMRLWFPLKMYAVAVFVFMYSLSIFLSFQAWLSSRIDLNRSFGFNPEASLLENVLDSLAILIVMQLYSYERRQSKYNAPTESNMLEPGALAFIKRFLIWHSNKVLFVALFYALVSPISAFGFLYLLGLIICAMFPKTSRVPSKSFLVYTGFIVAMKYLFQLWGQLAKMFPGQKHSELSLFLGLHVFESGFWGIESNLRGEVLVIVACTLQYNVFRWLDMMPSSDLTKGEWEEPCPLFVSTENEDSKSRPSVATSHSQPLDLQRQSSSCHVESSFRYFRGSMKESRKWNKKRLLALRNERFDMQKTTLKVYLMFWIENMFNLFGLEINMIVLLLASFVFLNVISLLYIGFLAAFILLNRRIIRKLWPILVFLFACVLILEYFAIWKNQFSLALNSQTENNLRCHDCWKSSKVHLQYCECCWLGLIVDDPRTLMSYFIVFIVACFKLRADKSPSLSGSFTYHQMMSQRKNNFVWKDLSFETKSMWTIFDYLRLYCYCHLLDLVLTLILVTGTLEYDILHLGYLGFAVVFFRLRLEILRNRNKIFKFLRMYNFAIIILSLAYQSPFVGVFNEGKCGTVGYIYEVIGFYKYDYGFRITSRSALVEIVIFILVSVQSYMFSSPEFEHVSRYLEAEQIGAIVREQEKKATWKISQLQHIRESEELKHQRNLQVEKMKSEMLDLQVQLHSINAPHNHGQVPPGSGSLRHRSASFNLDRDVRAFQKEDLLCPSFSFTRDINETDKEETSLREGQRGSNDLILPSETLGSPVSKGSISPSTEELTRHDLKDFCFGEISTVEEDTTHSIDEGNKESSKSGSKEHPLKSAAQLIGDGVSQVQSLGNQAVNNLANLLNVAQDINPNSGHSSDDDGRLEEMESQNMENKHLTRTSSLQSDTSKTMSESVRTQLERICQHIWSQMRSNNDIVCYCCFILVFLWSFNLLSMIYLAALFLYALCVNIGPSYTFWVVMLMYTEFYILLEYLYQIIIQHCGLIINLPFLQELGFPSQKNKSSFVISLLPLFVVYLFTLLQSSITAHDGDLGAFSEYYAFKRKMLDENCVRSFSSWGEKLNKVFQFLNDVVCMIARSCMRYWKSLTQGAESPPYFVQLSMDVGLWPEDGIQPEKIESKVNQFLKIVHSERCMEENPNVCPSASRVNIQSIERSEENPNMGLAVFEVVHLSPLTECTPAEWSKSFTPAADVAKEILIAKHLGFTEEVGFPYPIISVIGGGKREVDLYAYIFGADLAVFFLVAICYQSVIKNKSEFLDVYQLEDQFPKEFVFILMAIFFLIVVDRIIYLCSFATGKVLFYLFNLVLFTYAVTKYAWNMKPSQQYTGILALRAVFLTKAVSLALQAIQIRYGMPYKSALYRQFLTSNVSQINYLGYRLYRALPFLYELRCVLDWSCTTTSLTMYDWLKLEDISASLYLVKCDTILNRSTHKSGEKQTKMTKLCNGVCLFFILICVIWAPMLMYSSGNPTNIANPIKDASVQVDIKSKGGRLTLYQTTLCDKLKWEDVKENADLDPRGFLTTYNKNDIQLICCQADASTLWLVPEVVQKKFAKSLDVEMDIIFSWVFTRDRPKGKEVVKYERIIDVESDLPRTSEVQAVFNGSMKSFRVHNIYPRYFRVTGSGDVRPFEPEAIAVSADLSINRQNPEWWSFYDVNPLNFTGCNELVGPMAVVVSEETPQGILGDTLSKFSIWGLYITFVLAVGRFIRLQCSDLRMRIPFENLPSCDRLISICENIYAARAEGELGVEEVLYWTLVKIYRSPHMLLEYTKLE